MLPGLRVCRKHQNDLRLFHRGSAQALLRPQDDTTQHPRTDLVHQRIPAHYKITGTDDGNVARSPASVVYAQQKENALLRRESVPKSRMFCRAGRRTGEFRPRYARTETAGETSPGARRYIRQFGAVLRYCGRSSNNRHPVCSKIARKCARRIYTNSGGLHPSSPRTVWSAFFNLSCSTNP